MTQATIRADAAKAVELTDEDLKTVTGGSWTTVFRPILDDGTIHSPVTHGWSIQSNKKTSG